jgi:phosphoribosylaminoimidazole (AIR) synthetase
VSLTRSTKEGVVNDQYRREVIDPGDRASQLGRDICFASHGNCPAVLVIPHQPNNFRGPVGYTWNEHVLRQMAYNNPPNWRMLEEIENDGAGGKPQFFTLVGTPEVFRGLGWEIITMTADDFARSGRFPAVIVNDLNIKSINQENFHLVQGCFEGYGEALKQAHLVNLTGEIAIMKHSVTAFCDDDSKDQFILIWGATCIGLAYRDFLIDGSAITPEMPIVGFGEPGYRCNGGTFFTNLLLRRFGPDIKVIRQNAEAMKLVKQLTTPSLSYARTICRLVGWNNDGSPGIPLAHITGISHITGGGVWGKFGEMLPSGIGATLNNMPKPAEVLLRAQELSWDLGDLRLTDHQAYGTLHGGCGMLVICATNEDAATVVTEASRDHIQAQVVGMTHVEANQNGEKLIIYSQFKEGELLLSSELG